MSKNEETKKAVKEGNQLPSSNWIYVFNNFRDITGTINSIIPHDSLTNLLEKSLLKNEIEHYKANLRKELRDDPAIIESVLIRVKKILDESKNLSIDGVIRLPVNIWHMIGYCFVLYTSNEPEIDNQILYKILTSKVFYQYDLQNNSLKKLPIYDAVLELKNSLSRNTKINGYWSELSTEIGQKNYVIKERKLNFIDVKGDIFLRTVGGLVVISNISLLADYILNQLNGIQVDKPKTIDMESFGSKFFELKDDGA